MTAIDGPGLRPLRSVDELFDLLERSAYQFETGQACEAPGWMAILSHSLQCAEVLRSHAPGDLELQIAGLVHDLGHVAVPGDVEGHGRHGRVLFTELLGERVAGLVEQHVPAKRYLVTVEERYASTLSQGSVRTLAAQRGPMTPEEAAVFEADPRHQEAILLRRADEAAKVPGRRVPGIDHWRPVVAAYIASRRG